MDGTEGAPAPGADGMWVQGADGAPAPAAGAAAVGASPAELGLGEAARALIDGARSAGLPLRLLGGLAVRVLTPDFPPRARTGQDMDLASTASAKADVTRFLTDRGFIPDKQFNSLYGHKQMYFLFPDAKRAVDVVMDELNMCHVLDFRRRLDRMPYTLDVTDLWLTKAQIVELNAKDAQDLLYLLAAYPVRQGDEPGTIGLGRIGAIIGADWGWWRTVTRNLDRLVALAHGDGHELLPPAAPQDPVAQATQLREFAESTPKTVRWKLRARVGEKVRWYEEPEEVAH